MPEVNPLIIVYDSVGSWSRFPLGKDYAGLTELGKRQIVNDYESELAELENSLETDNAELEEINTDRENADLFMP